MIRRHARLGLCLLVFWLAAAARLSVADELQAWLEKNHDELIEVYRQFHRHPELSHKEVETAKRLAAELR